MKIAAGLLEGLLVTDGPGTGKVAGLPVGVLSIQVIGMD